MSLRTSWEILLVEDNPGDVRLVEEHFRHSAASVHLHAVNSAQDALAFLRRQGAYSQAPRPDLILLDLNLPGTEGQEVLVRIKEDQDLRAIPVIVLSTSDAEEVVQDAYWRHANCFICKPVTFEGVTKVLTAIEEFWLTLVRLPPRR